MKNYRLKKEAVPFIQEKHATKVYPLDTWESLSIDINALEEVKPAYITHGHKMSENSSTLGGWCRDTGATYEFTIHFPSVTFSEHDKFMKGRFTRELMQSMQYKVDDFYQKYLEMDEIIEIVK
jgi:hypothetical protein